MDPSVSGREAVPIYRDKKTGERISKEEILKSLRKIDEKPKEIKLEWGKGLAQKQEAETKPEELELEKEKPFAPTRLQQMDPSVSGREAVPTYRDKKTGERISKEELLKSQRKIYEKPKEIKLEWGKGLAQKWEAETKPEELELEKEKPFAPTRDDPELDKILKERTRWGDPMAHLVKEKHSEPVLANLGDDEKMKESGFVIPQDNPVHSWFKRGLDAAPTRHGI